MPEWENWGKPKIDGGPPKPKPSKYVNTPYGPVLRTKLGRGPTFSPATASQFAPGQVVGGYIDSVTLMCVPIIPNPIKQDGNGSGGGNGGGGGGDDVKTSTNANFTGLFFSALPNYSIQEALSLRSLTGNEILQVAHRQNFYTTAEVLNKNIIDIVESREFYSPTEIIKLQTPDYSYLFQNSLAAYDVSLSSSIITVSIPSSRTTQSAKIQVETFAPKYIKNDTIYT
jgi:hypothetical protein